MADFVPIPIEPSPRIGEGYVFLYSWTLTQADSAGTPMTIGANIVDITFQITGTFDGATLIFEGTNDQANDLTLGDDIDGSDMSYTAAPSDFVAPARIPASFWPSTSGGGASQSIVVTAAIRVAEGKP